MAFNVTLGEAKTQEKPFPKLMISSETGNVVLFIRRNEGTVIFLGHKNAEYFKLGEQNTDFKMSNFTDFNEPITLQNK